MDIVITSERLYSDTSIVDSSEHWIRAEELLPDGSRRPLNLEDPRDAEAYEAIQS